MRGAIPLRPREMGGSARVWLRPPEEDDDKVVVSKKGLEEARKEIERLRE